MTSSITVEPYETVEFPDSDTDSWQVVDPFDSENDDVITTESDVISSDDEDEDFDEEDEDVVVDDVIPSESDVISSEYDEDEDEDEDDDDDDEDEDDVISSDEEEDEDDVITSEDEEDEDEDDVITPMSSDEMINHTQELNKVYKLDAEDAYVDRMRLESMLYEEAMKEDAYIKRMQLEEEEHDEDEDEDDYDEDLDDELIPRWLNNKFERQRMRKLGKKVYPKMKKSKRMVNQYNRPGCAGAKHGLGLKHNLIG